MRLAMIIAPALACLWLSGCQGTDILSPTHPYDYRYVKCDEDSPSLNSGKVACVVRKLDLIEDACYEEKDPDAAKRCRNKIIGFTKKMIDDYWRQFVSDLFGRDAAIKTTLETSVTTLGAVTGITTPLSASKILAATATGLSALNTSQAKNFLNNNTADLVLGQMEADRFLVDQRMQLRMVQKIDDYPLSVAMSDLADYSLCLSIPHALQSLRQAGGKAAQETKETLAATVKDQQAAQIAAKDGAPPPASAASAGK